MILLLFGFIIYYAAIIGLSYGFSKIPFFENSGMPPRTKFTIIVPFRDEVDNLPILLNSISKLNYPIEFLNVILVDDESKEAFRIPNFKFQVSIIKNNRISNSPKKDAITTAMQSVITDWVITTDADCIVPENWLLTFDNYIQKNQVEMLAGAVTYQVQNSFLHHFQQLDLVSLQGATIGSFGLGLGFMCNGANFGYTKPFFHKLNGFEGNDTIASGDDVFLLQKAMVQAPEKVHYLKSKEVIVTTQPVDSWRSLFYQRVRWASKTVSYKSWFGKALGLVVFTGNLSWIFSFGFWILDFYSVQFFFFVTLLKFLVDFTLIYRTNRFLTKNSMRFLILSSLFYPFFSVCVALYSLFGKYEWKGRVLNK